MILGRCAFGFGSRRAEFYWRCGRWSEVHIIPADILLGRKLGDQFQGFHGTGCDAGLFTRGATLFAEIGGIDAQVAFGGLVAGRNPNSAMRRVWTRFEACLAADTFVGIGHSYIAVFSADMTGSGRTAFDTEGGGALAADGDLDVVRIPGQDRAANLDAGQRGTGFAFVN